MKWILNKEKEQDRNKESNIKLIDDYCKLSTGWKLCIGAIGRLATLDESIITRRIYGDYNTDEPLSLIGVLAMHGYDIHTKEFVEFWRGSWNKNPECSLFYRYINENTIEIKVIRRKGVEENE